MIVICAKWDMSNCLLISISYTTCRSIWLHFVSSCCSLIRFSDIICRNILNTGHTWSWSNCCYRRSNDDSSERIFCYNNFSCFNVWFGNEIYLLVYLLDISMNIDCSFYFWVLSCLSSLSLGGHSFFVLSPF